MNRPPDAEVILRLIPTEAGGKERAILSGYRSWVDCVSVQFFRGVFVQRSLSLMLCVSLYSSACGATNYQCEEQTDVPWLNVLWWAPCLTKGLKPSHITRLSRDIEYSPNIREKYRIEYPGIEQITFKFYVTQAAVPQQSIASTTLTSSEYRLPHGVSIGMSRENLMRTMAVPPSKTRDQRVVTFCDVGCVHLHFNKQVVTKIVWTEPAD